MKYTNKLNLPEPFLIHASKNNHEYKEHRYSVTELLLPVREILLNRKYADEIEIDIADTIPTLFGTAVHKVLEDNTPVLTHLNSEMSIEMEFDEDIVSGRIDLFDTKNLEITDYKTCSVSKIIRKDFDDFKLQGLMYALGIFKKYGLIPKRLKFPCLLKDWSKLKAMSSTNYPSSAIYICKYELNDSDFDYIEKWIKSRLELINNCIKTGIILDCTDEERWYTGTKYAVYKNVSDKKAATVCDTEEEAHNYISDKCNGAGEIQIRKGEYLKCKYYCNCSKFCEKGGQ